MNLGDIVIISFPFSDLISAKARPAVVVTQTPDFGDVVVCLITSVIPSTLHPQQIPLTPNLINNLRTESVIKVYRIATVESNKVLAVIGKLNTLELSDFKHKFISLVDTNMES